MARLSLSRPRCCRRAKLAVTTSALLVTLLAAGLPTPARAQINASVPVAGWSLQLEDVVDVPFVTRLEDIAHYGAANDLYVVEQQGTIHRFDPTTATPTSPATPTLWLDIGAFFGGDFNYNSEGGLRGLTFHPDFTDAAKPGYRKFYTTHSVDNGTATAGSPTLFDSPRSGNHDSVVAEWTTNPNGSVDTSSYRELMRIEQPFGNHNIGRLAFNPTAASGSADYGKLYIAIGDGGSGGDPDGLAQDIDTSPSAWVHGKILRVDPLASGSGSSAAPYTIPADNPFAGQTNRVQETWAYGLRNPHKFSWDPATGDMYVADIGQGSVEEINRVVKQGNYGWNANEGTFRFAGGFGNLATNHPTDAFLYPVAQYDHNPNNGQSWGSSAVTGGYVYRGTDIPELTGVYLFAEFGTNPGPIYASDVDDLVDRDDFTNLDQINNGFLAPLVELQINDNGTVKSHLQFLEDTNGANYSRTDIRFGEGPDGTIYVMNKRDGTVRKIVGVVGLAAGDANRDGSVDGLDLAAWQGGYGSSFAAGAAWNDGNFDASPLVDGADFLTWQRNYDLAGTNAANVPEPTTAALLLGLSAGAAMLRRKRAQHY